MKRLVKVALGFTTLATVGNAAADQVVPLSVGLTAAVTSSCDVTNAFVQNRDLSTQINALGGVDSPGPIIEITSGSTITCNAGVTAVTLTMASDKKGIINGDVILPYTINGEFGDKTDNKGTAPITITQFHSGTGPATDLLLTDGPGKSAAGTPMLKVQLDAQANGVAVAGSYVDTLTLVVTLSL